MTLPGVTSSVPPARRFVERALATWHVDDASWTATLVVSELAANAALHAGTEFTVVVEHEQGRVRLEVRDGSPAVPRQRRPSDEATTGRGLRLVADLALAWGVEHTDAGKAVWVELSAAADSGDDTAEEPDVDTLLASFGDADDEPGGPGPAPAGARWAA